MTISTTLDWDFTATGVRIGAAATLGVLYIMIMTFAWATPAAGQVLHLAKAKRVQISGPVKVLITYGDEQRVQVVGRRDLLDIESVDGTLYIEGGIHRSNGLNAPDRIDVSLPALTELVVSGAANVSVEGFTGDTLFIEGQNHGQGNGQISAHGMDYHHMLVNGAGQFEFDLRGRATHQDVCLHGPGRYWAERLLSQTSVVQVADSGQVRIWTEQLLDLDAADTAEVTYLGSPWINRQVSGGAQIRPHLPAHKPAAQQHKQYSASALTAGQPSLYSQL